MDIHLITCDPQLLTTLQQQIRGPASRLHGHIGTAMCRDPEQSLSALLSALLARVEEGLVLLETDGTSQGAPWEVLASLTAQRPGLNVVLMSHDAHKEQLLSAMRAGVREVIPCPPDDATLQSTLKRWTEPHKDAPGSNPWLARPRGQLIAFMACKGGAGSTVLATSLSHMLATEFDRPCAFIDMDLLYGDASFYLGQAAHPNTLADLATPAERLDPLLLASCMSTVVPGLQLLSAPPDMAAATLLQVHHVDSALSLACAEHPLVVMDLPRSMEPRCMAALAKADVIYLVMDNTMAAVRDAQRCLQYMQPHGGDSKRVRLIVNKCTSEAPMNTQTVQAALGMPIRHLIPTQVEAVNECIALGQALGQRHPHNPVTMALRQVAADLLQVPVPRTAGWLSRWLGRSSGKRGFTLTLPGAPLETRQP